MDILESLELRWFLPAGTPTTGTLQTWFGSTAAEEPRVDHYLITGRPDLGFKARLAANDPAKVETKYLVGSLGMVAIGPGITGELQRWTKLSLEVEDESLQRDGAWLAVNKTRLLRKFAVDMSGAPPTAREVPAKDRPSAGCGVELSSAQDLLSQLGEPASTIRHGSVARHQPAKLPERIRWMGPRFLNGSRLATAKGAVMSEATAIRPFQVNIPEAKLIELRRRIKATRWPEKETVADRSQGVPLAMTKKLAHYWETKYDWRKVEARLNSLPQFTTEIDGLNIHFIHVRSKHENALPIIVTHGWPGSIIEQLKIIGPLINPTAHGGKESDAFHVVIPSIPGYGFSGKPSTSGWDPARIGRAWAVLMTRLRYTRYVAQGGDWGAIIVDLMATQGHPELIGIHTNLPGVIPPHVDKAAAAGGPAPSGLSAEEQRAYKTLARAYKNNQFGAFMGSRPQTLYGIADSPVGLAAWLLDHDDAAGQPAAAVASALKRTTSATGELIRDEILDNITLYWLRNTGVSASRLYWEAVDKKISWCCPKNVSIPVAVSVFPKEVYHTPRSWAKQAYPKLIYFNKLDKGGHFAAWEQPKLFVEEIRAGFKSLR